MAELIHKQCQGGWARLNSCLDLFRKSQPEAYRKFLDAAGGKRVLIAEKNIIRGERSCTARVFIAMRPELEAAIQDAVNWGAAKACESSVGALSRDCWTVEMHPASQPGSEAHFIVLHKPATAQDYLALETDGAQLAPARHAEFERHMAVLMPVQEQRLAVLRESMAGILRLAEQVSCNSGPADRSAKPGNGKPEILRPRITRNGITLWEAGRELADGFLENLAGMVREHGIVGADFAYVKRLPHDQPAYFDFHLHPGMPKGYLVPASGDDMWEAGQGVFMNSSSVRLSIEALALRIAPSIYKLFFVPYFRDENRRMRDMLAVRAGYLHQAYRTPGGRHVSEDAAIILRSIVTNFPALEQEGGLMERIAAFRQRIRGGEPNERLVREWNSLIAVVQNAFDGFPPADWERRLWEVGGCAARMHVAGERAYF